MKEEKRVRVKPYKTRSPMQAKKFKDICGLETDNFGNKHSWICLDGARSVAIYQQTPGSPAKGHINISRSDFERIVNWYYKKQPVLK